MKLKIGEKELNIQFGYKPTLKENIISKLVRFYDPETKNNVEEIKILEDILLFLPELLLSGLQVNHEEYRYDYDTGEGKEEQLDKAFALIEEYAEDEEADPLKLFFDLENCMMENGFLKRVFKERKEEEEEKKVITKTKKSVN